MPDWPRSAAELMAAQEELAALAPPPWRPEGRWTAGGCFVCFERGAPEGAERAWSAAVVWSRGSILERAVVEGRAGGTYEPGLLALRAGALLEAAVRALRCAPDVLLVDATGRDHPRRAGLALHLGEVLDLPTVGVTHRPLVAAGPWPPDEAGAAAPLRLAGEVLGSWLRTRRGTRPLAVHAAWRTDAATALAVARATVGRARTPEPLRHARRLAREARAQASRRSSR